ncbi:MAG: DUF898 domain-containing protein [Myxococcales bacterium]|nr:DUF898 domain-containing protein [Myxococcales bacterium]
MTEATEETLAAAPMEPVRFRFGGNGGELFRIWIANLFLTIVTLGIYSAWAKVRTNRYLWANTQLGNVGFAYLAKPIAIMKGRLLVMGFFGSYALSSLYVPQLEIVFVLLMFGLMPWVVILSLAFRARNTAYRNIRFNFRGGYGEALGAYVLRPMLIPFTLGFAVPWVLQKQKQFIVEHSRFGTSPFGFGAEVTDFYLIYARAVVPLLLGGLSIFIVSTLLADSRVVVAGVLGAPLYLYLFACVSAGTSNLVFNQTSLGNHRFRSDLQASELFVLYLTNALGILLTLGIFIPWAKVRMARYRMERLALLPAGDLSEFVAAQVDEVEGFGAEFGDAVGFDFGL